MGKIHKRCSLAFKARIAVEAIKEEETVTELARVSNRAIELGIKVSPELLGA